jgi:hypothetical protein
MTINTKALVQYIRNKELPSAELIWEKECESTSSIEQMLQKANNQKNNDYQKAEYITAKFKLTISFELPLAILLLYII